MDEEKRQQLSAFIDAYIFDLTARLAEIKNRIAGNPDDTELTAALDEILRKLDQIDELVAAARQEEEP